MGTEELDSEFARRLTAMVEASGGRLYYVSGYRSVEEQQQLWDAALAEYGGNEEKAREWVAPPGGSNHNHGVAMDLGYQDDEAQAWTHANASRFGLEFPMSWEPWHIEPTGVREGTYQSEVKVDLGGSGPGSPDAYTTTPAGHTGATDPTRRFDLGYQLAQLGGILAGQVPDTLAGTGSSELTTAAQPTNRITGGGNGAL